MTFHWTMSLRNRASSKNPCTWIHFRPRYSIVNTVA